MHMIVPADPDACVMPMLHGAVGVAQLQGLAQHCRPGSRSLDQHVERTVTSSGMGGLDNKMIVLMAK